MGYDIISHWKSYPEIYLSYSMAYDIISHWKSYPEIYISYSMGYDILRYTYPILSCQPNAAS